MSSGARLSLIHGGRFHECASPPYAGALARRCDILATVAAPDPSDTSAKAHQLHVLDAGGQTGVCKVERPRGLHRRGGSGPPERIGPGVMSSDSNPTAGVAELLRVAGVGDVASESALREPERRSRRRAERRGGCDARGFAPRPPRQMSREDLLGHLRGSLRPGQGASDPAAAGSAIPAVQAGRARAVPSVRQRRGAPPGSSPSRSR